MTETNLYTILTSFREYHDSRIYSYRKQPSVPTRRVFVSNRQVLIIGNKEMIYLLSRSIIAKSLSYQFGVFEVEVHKLKVGRAILTANITLLRGLYEYTGFNLRLANT